MKRLFISLILFAFASDSFASVCDGVSIVIKNDLDSILTVKDIYSDDGSTFFSGVHSGTKILSKSAVQLSIRSSDNDLSGNIEFQDASSCDEESTCSAKSSTKIKYEARKVCHLAFFACSCHVYANVVRTVNGFSPILQYRQGDTNDYPGEIDITITPR